MLNAKECAILGVLSEGPIHGYELMNLLENRGYEQWTEISLPSVYRILADLEKQGYVTVHLDEDTRGAPKKLYTLTRTGKRILSGALLGHLRKPVQSRDSFDLGIAYAPLLNREQIRSSVQNRLSDLEARHRLMKNKRREQGKVPWNVEALFVHGEERYRAEKRYLRFILSCLGE